MNRNDQNGRTDNNVLVPEVLTGRGVTALPVAPTAVKPLEHITMQPMTWGDVRRVGRYKDAMAHYATAMGHAATASGHALKIASNACEIKKLSLQLWEFGEGILTKVEQHRLERDRIKQERFLLKQTEGMQVAHAVAQLLRRDETLIGDLPLEVLTRLVNECVEVPELEDYYVEHFLAVAAAIIPDVVVRLLLARIERAHENDRQGFKPLPFDRIPIKRDLLVGHAGYEQLLREIRDALRPKSWQRHEWVPRLFRTVAQLDDARTLRVLGEWVDSGDVEKIEDVAQLLTKAPPSFVFDQADFVARLLEAAKIGDVETEKRVRAHLAEPLISQPRSGGGGEPFPQDVALLNRAREAAARFTAGSPAARFYRDIERYAEGQIRGKLLSDEEIYDE